MPGINLAGVNPAGPAPTVGTEQRVRVQGLDFSGLLNTVEAGVAGYAKNKAAEAKKAKTLAENQLAQGELDIQFGQQAGASSEQLAKLATGYEDATGTNLSPKQKDAITQFQTLKQKIDDARDQGKADLGLELALNRYRKRFLVDHPELGPEALEISGKVNSLSKSAVDLQNEEATAQRKRVQQATDTVYSDLNAFGIQPPKDQGEAMALWQREIAPRRNSLAIWKNELDSLKAQTDITDLERQKKSDDYYRAHVDDLWGTVAADANRVLNQPGLDANSRAIALNTNLVGWEQRIRQEAGIKSNDEFQQKFGFIFDPLRKTMEGVNNGSISGETAKNQFAYLTTVAKQGFFKRNPKALAMLPVVDAYGPLLAAYAKDPTFGPTLGAILQSATSELAGGDPTAVGNLDITGGKAGYATPDDLSASAQRAGRISADIYNKPPSEQSKRDLVNLSVSFLTSPESKRTLAGVHDILPTIANPKFVEYSRGVKIPEDAKNMLNEYVTQIANNTVAVFTQEKDNIIPVLEADGHVTFNIKKPTSNQTKIKRVEADFNQAVKAMSHLDGNTDYKATALSFIGEINGDTTP